MGDDLLMVSEAARILERSPDSVRSYHRTGLLRGIRVGAGMRLFERKDVLRLKEQLNSRRLRGHISKVGESDEIR